MKFYKKIREQRFLNLSSQGSKREREKREKTKKKEKKVLTIHLLNVKEIWGNKGANIEERIDHLKDGKESRRTNNNETDEKSKEMRKAKR